MFNVVHDIGVACSEELKKDRKRGIVRYVHAFSENK